MQYDAILLELMSRIQVLEKEVAGLKQTVQALESHTGEDASRSQPYTKLTQPMMEVCYRYGKKAFQTPGAKLGQYADDAAAQTDMNRSSALMYIYAVKCMLEGNVFKRALSVKAIRHYLSAIYEDFGKPGLDKALQATRKHVEYRRSLGHSVNSIAALCDQMELRAR